MTEAVETLIARIDERTKAIDKKLSDFCEDYQRFKESDYQPFKRNIFIILAFASGTSGLAGVVIGRLLGA